MIPQKQMTCPGCSSDRFGASLLIPNQPVMLNYRFPSPAAAMRVPRADIQLVQCANCGLIFNSKFDSALLSYDANYENTQCCSSAFRRHLETLAAALMDRYQLRGRRVLEVGCGKGDFLKLICALGCTGHGYDTTYEGPSRFESPNIQFHTEYLTPSGVNGAYDLLICRHVVEHVPQIGEFLQGLHAIARAAGNPIVFIETPRFEWIAEQASFWDLFYEHCNYFNEASLRYLCLRAGFEVLRQQPEFEGQYQTLELRATNGPAQLDSPGIPPAADLRNLAAAISQKRDQLAARLRASGSAQGWAVWGAGAKGVALVNQLNIEKPRFVIDSNPAKSGCVIPGSEVPIVGPNDPAILGLKVILIANPNYSPEIRAELDRLGFKNLAICA